MSLTYLFLSAYHLVACTLQHMEDIEQYTEEESRLHHLDFPVLFEVSYKQRAVCHEHAGTLAAPWLICWWTCPVLISLWILLVSSFAEGLCKRQLTKQLGVLSLTQVGSSA